MFRIAGLVAVIILTLQLIACGGSSPSSAKGEDWNTKVYRETFISFKYPSSWVFEESDMGQIYIYPPEVDKDLFHVWVTGTGILSDCLRPYEKDNNFRLLIECYAKGVFWKGTITKTSESHGGSVQIAEGKLDNGKERIIAVVRGASQDGREDSILEFRFEGFPSRMEENKAIIKKMIESIQPRPS